MSNVEEDDNMPVDQPVGLELGTVADRALGIQESRLAVGVGRREKGRIVALPWFKREPFTRFKHYNSRAKSWR